MYPYVFFICHWIFYPITPYYTIIHSVNGNYYTGIKSDREMVYSEGDSSRKEESSEGVIKGLSDIRIEGGRIDFLLKPNYLLVTLRWMLVLSPINIFQYIYTEEC